MDGNGLLMLFLVGAGFTFICAFSEKARKAIPWIVGVSLVMLVLGFLASGL